MEFLKDLGNYLIWAITFALDVLLILLKIIFKCL
jgi:hypothetical protein